MTKSFVVLVGLFSFLAMSFTTGTILAHEGHNSSTTINLKILPSSQRVESIRYCNGTYEVVLQDKSVVKYKEFDLRFKTDSGPNGPSPETPVIIPAGMQGDRVFVIFSGPDGFTLIKKTC